LPAGALARLGTSRFLHGGKIQALVYSPDGTWLASAGADGMISIWDADSGKERLSLKGHMYGVTQLAVLPKGEGKEAVLVSGGTDRTIRFWDVKTGKELPQIINQPGAVAALALSPDGQLIASGSQQDGRIYLWQAATGKEVRRWQAHPAATVSLAFSADSKTLASGGVHQQQVGIAPNDAQTLALWDVNTGKQLQHFTGHDYAVTSVALSRDGKVVAAGGSFFRVGSPALPRCQKGGFFEVSSRFR